jgi:hypothetical protein
MIATELSKKPITASQLLDNLIKEYTSPEAAKEHWQDILKALDEKHHRKCSRTLVNKRVRKLYSKGYWTPEGEKPQLPPAQEPILKIETPETKEILPEPEPARGEVLPEPTPKAEGEQEKPSAEEGITEDERAQLKPILSRGIKRTFGLVAETLMKLSEDAGLSDQEADDSLVLLDIALARWTGTQLGKYYFETTLVLHFGSIAGRTLLMWREKRDKESTAKEEEERRTKAMDEEPEEQPQKKLEPEPEKPILTKEKPYTTKPGFLKASETL